MIFYLGQTVRSEAREITILDKNIIQNTTDTHLALFERCAFGANRASTPRDNSDCSQVSATRHAPQEWAQCRIASIFFGETARLSASLENRDFYLGRTVGSEAQKGHVTLQKTSNRNMIFYLGQTVR